MEQRPLRAGDSVDDYCPRERRVTSHAIVAVVDNEIRQTRCLTCDAEHEFKAARVPKPRKKSPAHYDQVLANAGGQLVTPEANGHAKSAAADANDEVVEESVNEQPVSEDISAEPTTNGEAEDLWVGHRPLIRATLPRNGNEETPPARPIPEFTMHQRQGRGGHGFRHGWNDRNGSGRGFRQGKPGQGHGQNRGPQSGGPGGGRSRNRHRNKSRRPR